MVPCVCYRLSPGEDLTILTITRHFDTIYPPLTERLLFSLPWTQLIFITRGETCDFAAIRWAVENCRNSYEATNVNLPTSAIDMMTGGIETRDAPLGQSQPCERE